jgi:cytoskeleton protein RodZ
MIENPRANADESQPIKDISPGNILLQARLQAGITQEQVAKELYMTISKVKALETDDYSRLSSDTFARGYIRAYANLVKVDVMAVLAAYDELIGSLKPASTVHDPVTTTAEIGQRGTWQFLIVIAAFLVGLWLISVWFFDNHSKPEYSAPDAGVPTETVQIVESVASSSLNNVAVSSASSSEVIADVRSPEGTGNPNLTAPVVGSTAVEEVDTLSTAAQINADANVKKNSLDEISFSFRAECWLEVSDSRGDVLATELEPAGGKIKLLGRAPFNVKLGNAPAVDIELNGKKVDVVPLIGTNVLILKVGN